MTVNVTEYATLDALEHEWPISGWWVGWIGERVCVVPLGDTEGRYHVSPACPCGTTEQVINRKVMQVHSAFDGRQAIEPDQPVAELMHRTDVWNAFCLENGLDDDDIH